MEGLTYLDCYELGRLTERLRCDVRDAQYLHRHLGGLLDPFLAQLSKTWESLRVLYEKYEREDERLRRISETIGRMAMARKEPDYGISQRDAIFDDLSEIDRELEKLQSGLHDLISRHASNIA
jgi:hypothetical protein